MLGNFFECYPVIRFDCETSQKEVWLMIQVRILRLGKNRQPNLKHLLLYDPRVICEISCLLRKQQILGFVGKVHPKACL